MVNKILYRNGFLSLICTGMCLVTIYSLVQPTAGNRQVSSFSFPDRIPLENWQLIKTESILENEEDQLEELMAAGKIYTYNQDNIPLAVEIRYLVGTRGNVQGILKAQTKIPSTILEQANSQELENIGFYTTFTYQNRAYLSSCINSRGGTTITQRQFSQNRYVHDLKYSLLLPWLLGKETIRDRRCLLTNMSIPIKNANAKKAYTILQKTWKDWYQWWQPRFPAL